MFCSLLFLINNKVDGDLRGIYLSEPIFLWFSLFVVLFVFIFFGVFLFPFIEKLINVNSSIDSTKIIGSHFFVLVVNVSYFIYCMVYKVGIAGVSPSDNIPFVLKVFFIGVQPLYFTLVYIAVFLVRPNKFFYLNVILFCLFSVLKGWLTYLIYVCFLFVYKERDRIYKHKVKFIFFVVFALAFSPVLKFIKVVVSMKYLNVSGFDYFDTYEYVVASGNHSSLFGMYVSYLQSTLERFQHTANVYYVIINKSLINTILDSNQASYFFLEGWPQKFIFELFFEKSSPQIQHEMAMLIENSYDWNAQVGLSGWIVLNPTLIPLILLYVSSLYAFCVFFAKKISCSDEVVYLVWLIGIVLLIHGWFYDVILFTQALLVFLAYVYVSKCISIK